MVVRRMVAATLAMALCLLAACGEPTYPRDVEGTLQRATGGVLHVGASEHHPWLEVADDGTVTGPEADLVLAYAASIGATVEWRTGSESELMELARTGEVDVVAGGLTSESPWTTHAALTKPYGKATTAEGKEVKLVLATRLGENALLTSIERFLATHGYTA